MNFKLIVVCFIFIGYQQLFAQKAITISDSVSSVTLSQFAEVFRDPTQKMGFTEVQKQKFMPVSAPAFQYAFSKDVFWFKVQVDNQSRLDQNNWYMVWSDGLKDHVDLYVQQPDGTVQIQYGGMLTPHAQKKYQGQLPVFRLGVLPKNQVSTYYVRLQADESIVGQLTLMTHQVYIDQVSTSLAPIWMEIGIQLLRVLYNIILALYIRNTSFRWYAFHTVIVTLSVLGSMGLIGGYFSDIPWLAKVLNSGFYQLMPATYTLFMYSLLQVPRHFPKLRWVFLSVVVLSVGQVLAVFWWPRTHLLEFNNYLFLFTEALLISTTLYAMMKQIKFNRYLLIPCFITLVPFLFLNLQALGIINFSWTYPLIYFTNFIEIVALSLVLGKIIDVTEKDKIRTEKALLTEKLEAEKLQELDTLKTRFFTNISHEFRTPLTLLVGPLADLRKKFPNEDLVQVMQRNVNRLQALINQLLDLSKFDAGELKVEAKKGDISQFFSYIFGSFETLAQNKNLHFNVHQSHRSLDAQFDADKLEKITTNLLSNAFKFTPSNGRIEVEVEYIPKETMIDVVLTVSDNGIGIDAQRLPRIFDRFYQVDDTSHRNYEGTGIGLALVKELVEILKGRISVKSEVNKGTTFRVAFTLIASPADMTAADATFETTHTDTSISLLLTEAAQEPIVAPTDDQPVLLIVEDNPDLRLYLRKIFETQYQIIEANDGQQGLEIALQNVPDMVITDLMMPRLDGFGLCERLKTDERTSHIPVVLLTAKATLTDRLEGLGLGADEYLQKPFNKDELVIRVKNLLHQRSLLREKFSLRATTLPSESAVGNEVSQQLDNQFIQRIRAVIDAHLSESSFDVDGLCKALGISRTNLHRKLKALTGTSATEFIRKIRLQRAAQLVQQNTLTVSEIAYQVGFESLSYFSKSFQEEFGMSPSEYGRTTE